MQNDEWRSGAGVGRLNGCVFWGGGCVSRGMCVMVRLIPLLMLCCATLASCQRPEAPPQTVSPQESAGVLKTLWGDALRHTPNDKPANRQREWKMLMTTWLPSEWPPTRQTFWTRYAYGLDQSMDGASDVSAPIARVEWRAGGESETVISMGTTLKVVAVHPVRPHGGWRYTLDDEERMLAMARSLTGAPPPEAPGTNGLKSYYQSWRLGNAEIAAHVEPRHRAFFDWVKSAR